MEDDENTFTVNQFGVVARFKKETYDMLTITEGNCFPSVIQSNTDYISDILSEDKNVSSKRFNSTGIEIKEHSG